MLRGAARSARLVGGVGVRGSFGNALSRMHAGSIRAFSVAAASDGGETPVLDVLVVGGGIAGSLLLSELGTSASRAEETRKEASDSTDCRPKRGPWRCGEEGSLGCV